MAETEQNLLPLDGLDVMPSLPRCEETGLNADLHLVVYTPEGETEPVARILTTQARHLFRKTTTLSVPLWMLTLDGLKKLEKRKSLPSGSKAEESIRNWLLYDHKATWRALFEGESARQEMLDLNDESSLDFGG